MTVSSYLTDMIKSTRHKGLWNYWTKGRASGLNASWLPKVRVIMAALEAAEEPGELDFPGSYFHALKGSMAGFYSVRLTGNYRVIFQSEADGFTLIDIVDYHR